MAGLTSLEAVKRKIKLLQEQADGAEEKVEKLQNELNAERKARETVRDGETVCGVSIRYGCEADRFFIVFSSCL